MLSHTPKNSIVLRFLNQSDIKNSPSFDFNISVSDIKSLSLIIFTEISLSKTFNFSVIPSLLAPIFYTFIPIQIIIIPLIKSIVVSLQIQIY